MYLIGQGHEHLGPGTSMVQRVNWTDAQERQLGMGCRSGLGCGCNDAGTCSPDCSSKGLGLFDSGMDFSTWGWPEWLIVLGGGYMVISTVFTTGRAVSRVRALPGERRKRKAASLRKRASELTSKKKKGGIF